MSNLVLYRKYRSMSFDEVVGQESVVKTLKRAVETGQVGHAYLLSGPRGVGKTSVARILSRAVNCESIDGGGNPCNQCRSCKSLLAQSNLDLIEVDAASHRGIDDVRFLQEGMSFAPTQSKKKVIIVDEVHMLTREAFNALLKTLEEPPEHAVFILATTEIERVPETVVSRCQCFFFRRLSQKDITNHLIDIARRENVVIEEEAAMYIAASVSGSMRDALGVLGQLLIMDMGEIGKSEVMQVLGIVDEKIIWEIWRLFFTGSIVKVLKFYYQQVNDKGVDLFRFMSGLEDSLRRMILYKDGLKGGKGIELMSELEKVEIGNLVLMLEILEEVKKRKFEIDSLYFEMFVNKCFLELNLSEGEKIFEEKKIVEENRTVVAAKDVEVVEKSGAGVNVENKLKKSHNLTRDQVKDKWGVFVERVKSKKPVLSSVLGMGTYDFSRSGDLVLFLPYSLQVNQINESENSKLLFDVFREVYGESCRVVGELGRKEDKQKMQDRSKQKMDNDMKHATGDRIIEDVVEIFDGEIIE
ncbi:DNA polymerase III subunit gamma/tau [Patescibacteria group bacterium]|nr:DNA polymerase III subunit gamma/tau [Patescibacteria group bacterium]